MAIDTLVQEIQNLSESSLQEVLRFVRFIKNEEQTHTTTSVIKTKTNRKSGWLKGKVIIAPDFDAPLDDFKEYM